jgi:sulfur-carrier protein
VTGESENVRTSGSGSPPLTGRITVRYWAAARAAAGVDSEPIAVAGELSLTALRARAVALHPDTGLADVLAVCAVLVGDAPVSSADPATVLVPPGATVEFLPPFAGG